MSWYVKRHFLVKNVTKALIVVCAVGSLSVGLIADQTPPKRRITVPAPVGRPVKGMRLPLYDAQGKVEVELDIESAKLLDERNAEMNTVSIQTFNQQDGKEIKVDLKTARVNLDTEIFTSKDPVSVSRQDFQLTGDGMEFNVKTRQGKVLGNVRMVIYDRSELQKTESAEQQENKGVQENNGQH
jgi:hypothetical protein